ncbi:hypothetical protein DFQ01_1446 [Paenibacillus cellulosilyticus]|uniref:MazG-like nucleotide pyrophosphohydrolase family protein n=1 Tax=Paenibacillus cellulosilyticus TaxID=375489 RepID=A0A2V2YE30_9BACL|nr:hypothetical protein [Paenibacillus cellulosilyticus]PWV90230.1 hypothetical protein DFQ01_1446 [Paenibacillus cellulosilyticus]QKS43390.1 hypothetical protein HUB94_02390 [Paenibacillus cellulosilyticus]
MQTTISDLVKAAHQTAVDKGWYEEPISFGDSIALIHSELSEALEEYRNGHGIKEVYTEGVKPCGVPVELADVVIRVFDICGHFKIDLENVIAMKTAYNQSRPRRHGGKLL